MEIINKSLVKYCIHVLTCQCVYILSLPYDCFVIHLPQTLHSLTGFFFILKVKELYAKADKLMISHPSDAPVIQQMKEELASNWEHIRALATIRYAKLQASFWWGIFSLD